jgi:hypothetical protein
MKMRKLVIVSVCLFNILFAYGQVESRLFPNNDALSSMSAVKTFTKSSKIKKMPSFDKQVLLDEDAANKGLDVPFRFGEGFDTNIRLSEGD